MFGRPQAVPDAQRPPGQLPPTGLKNAINSLISQKGSNNQQQKPNPTNNDKNQSQVQNKNQNNQPSGNNILNSISQAFSQNPNNLMVPNQNQNQNQNQIRINGNPLNDLGGLLPQAIKRAPQEVQLPASICGKHNGAFNQYCKVDHEPLCQVCIGQHFELHSKGLKTDPEFIPIGKALDQVRDKMANIRDKIESQMRKLDTEDIIAHLQDMVQRVIISKKQMISQVNKIAESRLKDIQIIQTNYRKVQLKKPFKQASEIVNKYIDGLRYEKRIQMIQYAYLFDDQEFLALFHKIVKENKSELEKSKCEIIYDKVQFRKMIAQCFRLNIPSYGHLDDDTETSDRKTKRAMGNKIFESFQNNLNKAAEQERDMKTQHLRELIARQENKNMVLSSEQNQKIQEQKQQKKQRQTKKLVVEEQSKPAVTVNQPGTVKQALTIKPTYQLNYVHYFETGSFRLHLYNLGEGTLETRMIKAPDPIPFYHKSVHTSDSSLFVSGGKINTNKNSRRNTQLWTYNIIKDNFRVVARNLKPRSSHSLVQHNGFLYIIGGFNETNFEREVERFDLPDAKKIYYCTPSKYAGQCITAGVGDYIWKISMDGLQVYSPKEDDWFHIIVKNFYYFESSMCANIAENQVFVFGGYDQSQRGVKNSYVLRQSKNIEKLKEIDGDTFEITKKNKYMLTDAQGFSDNTVAMTQNNLYAWINDSNEYNQVRTDKKTLITFDSYDWRYVPVEKDQLKLDQ